MSWLVDNVYAIRDAATVNLKKLVDVFGIGWAQQHVIPRVLELKDSSNYLYRLTALQAIAALASTVGPEVVTQQMLPLVVRMGQDPVPNVRFNVARTLQILIPLLDSHAVQAQIKPVLSSLHEDADKDVKFFSMTALQLC